jgi:hypothetical protein
MTNGTLIDSTLIDGTLIDSTLIDSTLIDSTLIDGTLIDGTLTDGTPDEWHQLHSGYTTFFMTEESHLRAFTAYRHGIH